MTIKNGLLFLIIFVVTLGCKRQLERPTWEVDVLAPLIKSSISIKSLVADSTYKLDTDSSVILVFKQSLDSFSLKGLDEFKIKPFYNKIKLSSLKLNTDTITQFLTLGQIARQLLASSDQQMQIVGVGILLNQGKRINIPDFNNITAAAVPFNVTEWFKYAIIRKGNLNLSITNKLPITVSSIQFDLTNKTLEPRLVLSTNFINIRPNETKSESVPLDNKKVEGNLEVAIQDLDLTGGNNILIDTNAALKIQVVITDIELEEADAIFPAQNVVTDTVEVPITLVNGIEAKEAILEKGIVRINVLSTIQDSLFYTYKIPNAITPQGTPFIIVGKVPPSKGGIATKYEYVADFSGFKLDMRGGPGRDTVNAFYSNFVAAIRYSGKPVFLSLVKDSLEISITMENLKPSYLRGYIKQDTILEATSNIDLFRSIRADAIDFKKISLKLDVKNSFGVTVDIIPEFLKSFNATGQSATLEDPLLIGVERGISAATDNPLKPATLHLKTANAAPLFNLIPQRVAYRMRIKTGRELFPGGPKFYNDFVYNTSSIAPTITIEAPLNFSAKKIVLQDTISLSNDFKNQVTSGKFTMIVKNGFPLKILINLKFIDELGKIKSLLLAPLPIAEGLVDATSLKVTSMTDSKINYVLTADMMKNISMSNRLIIEAQFDTQPESTQIKIYDYYKLDVKIVGDINYQVN